MTNGDALLNIAGLTLSFQVDGRSLPAVEDVTFSLERGKTLGIVGESGCGKSVTALSIVGLNPVATARISSGQIVFEGRDLLQLPEDELTKIRGNRIAMIFQEPMTALNPVFTVGEQIAEVFRIHQGLDKEKAHAEAIAMMDMVGIPAASKRASDYPHQLSGGMRQRIMIAMALSCRPALLIADEPTTALDVTIQAQILDLMRELKRETNMAMIFITHDLGVVAEMCDSIAVMYAGNIVETAPVRNFYERPLHPYTKGLMNSLITLELKPQDRLHTIKGEVPALGQWPSGCHFASRCPLADDECRSKKPPMRSVGGDHCVSCYKANV